MHIPETAWFAVSVAGLAGRFAWHRRTPSRHLAVAAAGLGWSMLTGLPGLYGDLFGYEELSRLADRLFNDSGIVREGWPSTGRLLAYRCGLLAWPGVAFFALGLWRLGSAMTPETPTAAEP